MTSSQPRLRRQLGVYSAAAVLVGSTIGSGIFRVPSTVAGYVGSVGAIAAVWCIGAAIALCGALALSLLAVRHPQSGGIYVFLRESYGRLPAFLFGWTALLIIRPAALGAIASIFAAYAGGLAGLDDREVRYVAIAVIAVIGLANIRSVRLGAWIENVTTAAKVGALVVLATLAFALGGNVGSFSSVSTAASLGGFGAALVAVMWAYDGWADLTFMAGEVRDPLRVLPRALIGGTAIVVAVYLLVNAAYLRILPIDAMAASELVAADAAVAIVGQAGAAIIAALVVLSTFGALNGSLMTGPRIFFAMADDRLLFRAISAVHPAWHTPWAAVALTSILGMAFVSVRTFEQLANAFVLGIWPFYALAVGAVLRRQQAPDALNRTMLPGRAAAIVFLAASLFMLGDATLHRPASTMAGFAVILAGTPVFLWLTARGTRPGMHANNDGLAGSVYTERPSVADGADQ